MQVYKLWKKNKVRKTNVGLIAGKWNARKGAQIQARLNRCPIIITTYRKKEIEVVQP